MFDTGLRFYVIRQGWFSNQVTLLLFYAVQVQNWWAILDRWARDWLVRWKAHFDYLLWDINCQTQGSFQSTALRAVKIIVIVSPHFYITPFVQITARTKDTTNWREGKSHGIWSSYNQTQRDQLWEQSRIWRNCPIYVVCLLYLKHCFSVLLSRRVNFAANYHVYDIRSYLLLWQHL